MRRITIALVITLGILTVSTAIVDACGDKLLRIGRGARFQHSIHTASILIYIHDGTATTVPRLQSFLKRAGHKPRVVQGMDNFSGALNSGQYDVVLSDLSDVPGLQKQIETSSSKPSIVPIAIKATKAEQAAAKKQYKCLVKDSDDGEQYLDAIEAAMKSRAGTR
jgi:DNA-binding NtrC family response regulator